MFAVGEHDVPAEVLEAVMVHLVRDVLDVVAFAFALEPAAASANAAA